TTSLPACAATVPNSSARSRSTRTSTGSASCVALRASSSDWPSSSAKTFDAGHGTDDYTPRDSHPELMRQRWAQRQRSARYYAMSERLYRDQAREIEGEIARGPQDLESALVQRKWMAERAGPVEAQLGVRSRQTVDIGT